ncbi:hypothetical protein CEXT_582581 [Caerostris extrusa]|uniref:Uncharacterized protein n=1 Tax=Caerostris extrusa TaxID=172846 RepID=A0AAV4YCL5_CAEEX|nr:hypothetical protein CEXT_582581 [Caerostris extrusa]
MEGEGSKPTWRATIEGGRGNGESRQDIHRRPTWNHPLIFDARIPFKVATPCLTVKPRKRKSTATPSISVNQKIKTTNSIATLSDLETDDELATNIGTMAIQNLINPPNKNPP